MTRKEAEKVAARLLCVGRAVGWLSLPIQISATWVQIADLPEFTDEVEKHARALAGVLDVYLAKHPGLLGGCEHDTRLIVENELGDVRKDLALIPKIALGSVELNIGENYLPREEKGGSDEKQNATL